MHIAVNIIFLQKNKEYDFFVQEIFSRLAKQHPEHEFYFLLSGIYDQSFFDQPNMKLVVMTPVIKQVLLFKWAYDIRLPLVLRSVKADVLIQPYGFCNLITRVPQLLIVNNSLFKQQPPLITGFYLRRYYRLLRRRSLHKAGGILADSEFAKKVVVSEYKMIPRKISVMYGAAGTRFQPANEEERQNIKDKYSGGKGYFLLMGEDVFPEKNLLNVLKAFSLFKKWQLSNMKLVINIFFPEGQLNKAKEKLKSYKYRDDVIWPDRLADAEMPGIMASAYGMLFFSSSAGSALPVMEVMQSGVPVILNDTAAGIAEIAGDAGLYVDPADPGAVAQQMIRLYKDETLRTRLIREGENRTASFSWDNTTDVMWDNLEKTVSSFQPVQSGSI